MHFSILTNTTLFSSPYQDHDLIAKVGNIIAKKYNLDFIWSDEWIENYYNSKNEARAAGIYIQKYCGCLYSKMDRKLDKIKK